MIPAAGDLLASDPRWRFLGLASKRRYAIVLKTGLRRELTPRQARTYVDWRNIARERAPGKVRTVAPEWLAVLTRPGPLDRARIAVWHGLERSGLTLTDLETRTGITRKTLARDLTLGRPAPRRTDQAATVDGVLERALDALDATPARSAPGASGMLGAPLQREPTALTRLRYLAVAQHGGLLELESPPGVHSAFRAQRLEVAYAGVPRPVTAGDITVVAAAVADEHSRDTASLIVVV